MREWQVAESACRVPRRNARCGTGGNTAVGILAGRHGRIVSPILCVLCGKEVDFPWRISAFLCGLCVERFCGRSSAGHFFILHPSVFILAVAPHTAAADYLCLCTLWQNGFRFRMTLLGGFVFLVPRFGDADMAKKLSPEEAAVMIIRRRLQQVETAKKAPRRSDEPEKARAAKAQPPKPSRAGR
jgi:hypothetical protein